MQVKPCYTILTTTFSSLYVQIMAGRDNHLSLGPTNKANEWARQIQTKFPLMCAQPWTFYTQLAAHLRTAQEMT